MQVGVAIQDPYAVPVDRVMATPCMDVYHSLHVVCVTGSCSVHTFVQYNFIYVWYNCNGNNHGIRILLYVQHYVFGTATEPQYQYVTCIKLRILHCNN